MKFSARSLIVLILLYGLVFAIGDLYLVHAGAPLSVGIAFVIALVGVQFLAGPYIIEMLFTIHWFDLDSQADRQLWNIPDETREFVETLCKEHGIKQPRLGVIASGTPNAFSFGHAPADARVVVTTGLIEALTPSELNAVLAHEIGHVEHWDFVVMMIAALVPVLLYQFYVFLRHLRNAQLVAYGVLPRTSSASSWCCCSTGRANISPTSTPRTSHSNRRPCSRHS
jgi:heat shock protein HtpX